MPKIKKAEVTLNYQQYIPGPPSTPQSLYQQACSNDGATIGAWRDTWIKNVTANHKKYGPFKECSIASLFKTNHMKPAIIAGSGPSLVKNGVELKDRGDIPLISCLHNFHYMEDNDLKPEYYVTLDAGDITVGEVSEGGAKTEAEYWEITADRTLLAFIGSPPALLDKWKGKILFFNCPVPDEEFTKVVEDVEIFNVFVSNGGNVLGGCLYIAKSVMGSNPITFVGADFAFSYENKFHGWDSKYDGKMGHTVKAVDVFGMPVQTWQSYANFKSWFEFVACQVPGNYVNCTEGGTFGAYPEGNIMQVQQMDLCDFYRIYNLVDELKECCENSEVEEKKVLF